MSEARQRAELALDSEALAAIKDLSIHPRRNASAQIKALGLRLEYTLARPVQRLDMQGAPLSIRVDLSAGGGWDRQDELRGPVREVEVEGYGVPVKVLPAGPEVGKKEPVGIHVEGSAVARPPVVRKKQRAASDPPESNPQEPKEGG